VGPGTTQVLRGEGIEPAFVPERADARTLAAELPIAPGDAVLLPRSDLADPASEATLRERGATVAGVVAYRTVEAPESSLDPLANALAAGPLDAVVLASPSAVRGLVGLLPPAAAESVLAITAVCIGETTAAAAGAAGFTNVVVASSATPAALATRLAELLEA
jgi:uroporphyrinogen-III synthase